LDFQYGRNFTEHPKIKYEQTKIILNANKNQTLKRKVITIITINKLTALFLFNGFYSVTNLPLLKESRPRD
jgi:preprotein translocase subunit SecF